VCQPVQALQGSNGICYLGTTGGSVPLTLNATNGGGFFCATTKGAFYGAHMVDSSYPSYVYGEGTVWIWTGNGWNQDWSSGDHPPGTWWYVNLYPSGTQYMGTSMSVSGNNNGPAGVAMGN